jgi:hypothetical protein
VEVQVAGIDPEAFGELAVRERVAFVVARPESLEDAQAQRVPERLQLLGLIEHEDVEHPGRLGRHAPIYTDRAR